MNPSPGTQKEHEQLACALLIQHSIHQTASPNTDATANMSSTDHIYNIFFIGINIILIFNFKKYKFIVAAM